MPGAAVRKMSSLDEVVASQHRQHQLFWAFRQELGYLSDEEWQQLFTVLKVSPADRRELRAAYRELHRKQRGPAPAPRR
jgi:hypothetical protein